MSVSTSLKRASLDDAFDASVGATPATSLRAKLRAYETTARTAIASGQVISSVSSNNGAGGRSTSFSVPNSAQFEGVNPVSIAEMWRELIDLFDDTYTALGGTPTDTQVKTEMMGLLKPCREIANDFSTLICGRSGPV